MQHSNSTINFTGLRDPTKNSQEIFVSPTLGVLKPAMGGYFDKLTRSMDASVYDDGKYNPLYQSDQMISANFSLNKTKFKPGSWSKIYPKDELKFSISPTARSNPLFRLARNKDLNLKLKRNNLLRMTASEFMNQYGRRGY